jgi:hypothetical protein
LPAARTDSLAQKSTPLVIAGLDPAIHQPSKNFAKKDDARVNPPRRGDGGSPVHDELVIWHCRVSLGNPSS